MAEVRFGAEAEAEYLGALAWYQERSWHAAEGFESAVAATVARIADAPEQYPLCDEEGYRFAIVPRCPYSLIYRVLASRVQVVAVARRTPGYWSGRP